MSFEPPIQNPEKLDIVGERNDGGVDLIILVSGPLVGSAATLSILERKIRNYIGELSGSEFKRKYSEPKSGNNCIYVVSEYPVDALVLGLIEQLKPRAKQAGAELELRRSME